jgi:serine/threonine-protein kinase
VRESAIAVAAARLIRPAPDVRTLAPGVPEGLAALVAKLLARARDERHASALEVKRALDALKPALEEVSTRESAPVPVPRVVSPRLRTVAVLPLLATPDEAYVADGVTEDLVDLLSAVPEIRVRPRGDTSKFVQSNRQVREIGRSLGVDVVVDGSLRRAGDDVRVSVRLITVEDGFQLWARRFDRRMADVLLVAESAAAAISRALTARDVRTAQGHVLVDAAAQELYLRGRHLLRRAWYEWSYEAAKLLREAAARAPDDARIAGTLGVALARIYGMGVVDLELAREARATVDRALRIDPAQPEARVARGLLHMFQGEAAASVTELRHALDDAPNHVDALDALGRILVEIGREDEGRALIERALSVEPDLVLPRTALARSWATVGDWTRVDEALGPPPSHPGDLASWLLTLARHTLWIGTPQASERLEGLFASVDLGAMPEFARDGIAGIIRVARTRALDARARASLEGALAVSGLFSPRRTAFNAQLRVEIFLACGLVSAAVEMLAVADANALLDLVWLDRCPLLGPVRSSAEFERVRSNTLHRVARVLAALDATRSVAVSGVRT